MLDLGLCLHNTGSRPKDAIRTFQETIEMDPEDHLVSWPVAESFVFHMYFGFTSRIAYLMYHAITFLLLRISSTKLSTFTYNSADSPPPIEMLLG